MRAGLPLAAALCLAGAAAPAAAAPRERAVEPAAIANAALACRGVPDDFAAAQRRIEELGWPRIGGRGEDGEQLPMFERDGLLLLVIPPDEEGHPMSCGLMATVRRSVRSADITAAFSAALAQQPGPDSTADFPVWTLADGQVVSLGHSDGGVLVTFWYPRNAPRPQTAPQNH